MQISLKIDYKIFICIGLALLLQSGLNVRAQVQGQGQEAPVLSSSFIKPELSQKSGQLSFNVVRIRNLTDTAVRFKPLLIFPAGWIPFSSPFSDTVVQANDSISLPIRFQLPDQTSSEIKHEIIFRAYSMQNKLLSESNFSVQPEAFRDWDATIPDKRVFFYPRMNLAEFELHVQNKGNTAEEVNLVVQPDNKLNLDDPGDWKSGRTISLEPYQDTVIKFKVNYAYPKKQFFDVTKMQVHASAGGKDITRNLLIEKYTDTYSPFHVDRGLPHQVEVGFRTFSGNDRLLPFIKTRGTTTFNNSSTFQYNFNYYALTGNEDIISNSYYTFVYNWKLLKVGLGAFSSQLGRNLYTRNGLVISNAFKFNPVFGLEAFFSQSFFTPKTSVAVGYVIEKNKFQFHGSVAYDVDNEKKLNTGSLMFQTNRMTFFKKHDFSLNLYGYNEYHYLNIDYSMLGFAWDFSYYGRIGNALTVQVTNNYGSPNIPGPQMGLINFGVTTVLLTGNNSKFFSIQYINASRIYHSYNMQSEKLPDAKLYDQYANIVFHSSENPNHKWEIGPSVEFYRSLRPSETTDGLTTEYTARKLRLEYKATIFQGLSLNLKTGVTNNVLKETTEIKDQKFDFHLLGGYSFKKGYGVTFSYDNGPMVNSGLYQFAGDAGNHSCSFGPSMMTSYFNDRVNFNLFAGFNYRFDLKYASVNINPKIEAYLFNDFYAVASGTYHYTRQEFPAYQMQNSYTYFELSIKKRWGKSAFNKWQKSTRRLKVVLFKDDNGNGVKEPTEQPVPFVKTRLKLSNSENPALDAQFPVDIILLSNKSGIVIYNHVPKGFYELTLTPLGDVKEYFYVNRSTEKLELTKNRTYYVPFQKASKISGKITVQRSKYIKPGEEGIDLTNIKITAYNKQGNSYSSFTLKDGSFTIFLPGNDRYNVRMGNVFGPNFKILENDISIAVPDSNNNQILFNVVEIARQVKFKEAKPKPAEPDSLQQEALKIKVLHGKFYENSNEVAVDKNAIPVFDIKEAPIQEQPMINGNYYVVIGIDTTRTEAVKLTKIVIEQGFEGRLGYNEADGTYYVYTKYFQNKGEAKEEYDRMRKAGFSNTEVIRFE